MKPPELVKEWATKLSEKLDRSPAEISEKGLFAYDFSVSQQVELTLADQSFCRFRYAFALIDEEKKLVAVFTEHCGHHVFSLCGAIVKEITEDIYADGTYEE